MYIYVLVSSFYCGFLIYLSLKTCIKNIRNNNTSFKHTKYTNEDYIHIEYTDVDDDGEDGDDDGEDIEAIQHNDVNHQIFNKSVQYTFPIITQDIIANETYHTRTTTAPVQMKHPKIKVL